MKKTLRGEMNRVKAKSRLDRWMGATSTGPSRGMRWRPETEGRNITAASTRRIVEMTR